MSSGLVRGTPPRRPRGVRHRRTPLRIGRMSETRRGLSSRAANRNRTPKCSKSSPQFCGRTWGSQLQCRTRRLKKRSFDAPPFKRVEQTPASRADSEETYGILGAEIASHKTHENLGLTRRSTMAAFLDASRNTFGVSGRNLDSCSARQCPRTNDGGGRSRRRHWRLVDCVGPLLAKACPA